jgi:hypothetical protein
VLGFTTARLPAAASAARLTATGVREVPGPRKAALVTARQRVPSQGSASRSLGSGPQPVLGFTERRAYQPVPTD